MIFQYKNTSRLLYENYVAGEKWKYIVTVSWLNSVKDKKKMLV